MNIYLREKSGWRFFENLTIDSDELKERDIVLGKDVKLGDRVKLGDEAIVNESVLIYGGYRYSAGAFVDEKSNISYIQLGCCCRSVEEWENDFDNNLKEFPLESWERIGRYNIYLYLKNWIKWIKDAR